MKAVKIEFTIIIHISWFFWINPIGILESIWIYIGNKFLFISQTSFILSSFPSEHATLIDSIELVFYHVELCWTFDDTKTSTPSIIHDSINVLETLMRDFFNVSSWNPMKSWKVGRVCDREVSIKRLKMKFCKMLLKFIATGRKGFW